ncbi:dimethylsulfonioproprionate lyase family protein [Oceanibium sediminis]|uniref:dimethylsulfonioproprionate lyase family protein n=1 Tax=Oceanibium sediminis TaxID=2026339 RepID=UPI000DD38D7D|nr:dimethylsulfonioproprionate lyase family protein [Oceanibium sediminis]
MSEAPAPLTRLGERPDFGYLLREFYELYRRSSAGGSARIRTHQRTVREAISRVIAADPEILDRVPEHKPVCAHLPRAMDKGMTAPLSGVVRAVVNVMPDLSWLYGYDKLPAGLGRKFAYAEIAGPHGPVTSHEVILGLVLFAPKCTYPAHAHEGLTESYYILSGAVSENDTGVASVGSLIFNPPGHLHRITVDDREPALLSYAWVGDPQDLAGQKMAFTRPRTPRQTRG